MGWHCSCLSITTPTRFVLKQELATSLGPTGDLSSSSQQDTQARRGPTGELVFRCAQRGCQHADATLYGALCLLHTLSAQSTGLGPTVASQLTCSGRDIVTLLAPVWYCCSHCLTSKVAILLRRSLHTAARRLMTPSCPQVTRCTSTETVSLPVRPAQSNTLCSDSQADMLSDVRARVSRT